MFYFFQGKLVSKAGRLHKRDAEGNFSTLDTFDENESRFERLTLRLQYFQIWIHFMHRRVRKKKSFSAWCASFRAFQLRQKL